MTGVTVSENGELRILGTRLTAVDAQSLCNHLDALVGVKVGEVIMHNLEFRLGKLDASKLKTARRGASTKDLIAQMITVDRLTGVGLTTVTLPEDPSGSINVEVANPSVKGIDGSAKSFMFSYWAGALTALLEKEFDVKNVVYNEEQNLMKSLITPRDMVAARQ